MITITRRHFMQAGAAAGAMLALPIRAFPFSQSVMPILKFKVALPGLVAQNADPATTRGIPLLSPTTTLSDGTQVYEIEAGAFKQRLLDGASTDNPDVSLWGYGTAGHLQYLGGVIVANKDVPVRLEVKNNLPAQHILPVDLTLIDPEVR